MKFSLLLLLSVLSISARGAKFEGDIRDWKQESHDKFSDPEVNFKAVMKILREKYVDASVTDEDLYRAAAAGLLSALNSGDEGWNKLMSPRELQDLQIEMTGQLTGIGATLSFDKDTGYAKIHQVIPGSAALKAGLRKDDQILSVNGEKFKGKTLTDMVILIRGPVGQSVKLKVLREDKILPFQITRDQVRLENFVTRRLDEGTALLEIGAFTKTAPQEVRSALNEYRAVKLKKLIIDLRGNQGGGFDQALSVAGIFLPKNAVIARTVDRQGRAQEHLATGEAWSPQTRLVVLTDENTFSGAELLAASLKENRKALLVGTHTHGKWSVQSVEELPNKFTIKYSVMQFQSPSGQSYQGTGIKPDFEVSPAKEESLAERWSEKNPQVLLGIDTQLKAAAAL